MNGADAGRIVEIRTETADGPRRGSGYLVRPGTVLTAAHVAIPARRVECHLPDDPDHPVVSGVALAWSDPENDVAVLTFPSAVFPSGAQDGPPARSPADSEHATAPAPAYGKVPDRGVVSLRVYATGFPLWKVREQAGQLGRVSHCAQGRVGLLSNLGTGTLEITTDGGGDTRYGQDAWGGMSGAVLWVEDPHGKDYVIGVITAHYPQEGGARLTARPLAPCLLEGDEERRRKLARLLGQPWPPQLRNASRVPPPRTGWPPDAWPAQRDAHTQVWNIPEPDRSFVGRESTLKDLGELLQPHTSSNEPLIAVLHGTAGVGKSQLARRYAAVHREEFGIGWSVDATSRTSCLQSLSALAVALGTPASLPADEKIQAMGRQLATREDWLLVLDSARAWEEFDDLLPRRGGGTVVVTSRNPHWPAADRRLAVEVLQRQESTQLLMLLSQDDDHEAAARLAAELGDLPVALEVAGRLASAQYLTLRQYLDRYRRQGRHLTAWQDRPDAVERLVLEAAAWVTRYDPRARLLLRVSALLAAEHLPVGLLHDQLFPATGSAEQMIHAELAELTLNALLLQSGLFSRTGNVGLRMHQVFQEVIMASMSEEERPSVVASAIDALARLYSRRRRPRRVGPLRRVAYPRRGTHRQRPAPGVALRTGRQTDALDGHLSAVRRRRPVPRPGAARTGARGAGAAAAA